MSRVGTLLDQDGRPEARVQIVRKSKKTTKIRRPTNYGRSWSTTVETVPTDLILDDGGQRFEQHSDNPRHATWLDLLEKPQGRLQVQRVYKHVTKAKLYIGDNTWTEVQDFPTKDILFDGGASIGWTVPEWHREEKTTSGKTSETTAEKAPTPAPKQETPTSTPKGQRFSYIRVSSTDQNLARQREMVGPVDKEFCDELSARSRVDRPGLERCLDYLRDHDELRVASIDRLARSLVDLRTIIDQATEKGATVHFVKENLTFEKGASDPRATLMLGILGSFAEFERAIIRERQAEGIALAKKAGKYKGRRRALTPAQVEQARIRADAGESKVSIARDLGVGRSTLYRALGQGNSS